VFLLLVGRAKTHRDINGYISFLNTTDWSVFHRSQPATRADPFWPSPDAEVSIEDMLDTEEDVDILNAFDPAMEDELDSIADDEVTLEEEDFGFVTDETHNSASEDTSTIQQLMEQRN
jgi:hypothetical protein